MFQNSTERLVSVRARLPVISELLSEDREVGLQCLVLIAIQIA